MDSEMQLANRTTTTSTNQLQISPLLNYINHPVSKMISSDIPLSKSLGPLSTPSVNGFTRSNDRFSETK